MALGSTYTKANKSQITVRFSNKEELYAEAKLQKKHWVKRIFLNWTCWSRNGMWHTECSRDSLLPVSLFPPFCVPNAQFGRRKLWISKATFREMVLTLGETQSNWLWNNDMTWPASGPAAATTQDQGSNHKDLPQSHPLFKSCGFSQNSFSVWAESWIQHFRWNSDNTEHRNKAHLFSTLSSFPTISKQKAY